MNQHPNGNPMRTDLKRPVRNDESMYEENVFPDTYLGKILKGLGVLFLSKQEPRLGWPRKSACSESKLLPFPNETVAAHQWGVATIVNIVTLHPNFQEELPNFNRLHAIEMSLIHDVAEVVTGDITPVDGITPEEKHEMEKAAMVTILGCFPKQLEQSLHTTYRVYEDRESDESKFVKDCDRLDFLIQAFLLERQGFGGFSEFYDNTIQAGFYTKIASDLASTLMETRTMLIDKSELYRKSN